MATPSNPPGRTSKRDASPLCRALEGLNTYRVVTGQASLTTEYTR